MLFFGFEPWAAFCYLSFDLNFKYLQQGNYAVLVLPRNEVKINFVRKK